MTAPPEPPFDLGWHAEWLLPTVEQHAIAAFVEAYDLAAKPAEAVWKRVGAALLADVAWCTSPVETPDFVSQAQTATRELYLQSLRELVATSPLGGRA